MGCVYFIKADRFVKIGGSNSIQGRVQNIQTYCPFEAVLIGTIECDSRWVLRCERFVQANCADWHVRGEWYEMTEAEALELIAELTPKVAQVVEWHEATDRRMRKHWEARDRARIEKAKAGGS